MSSSSDSDMDSIPDEMEQKASTAKLKVLPKLSKERYLKVYEEFMMWREHNQVESLSEKVFITYFNELASKFKPSSLWSSYSMLKATVNSKHGVNIKNYKKLTEFLKQKSYGFKSKKSKVFTPQDIQTFLNEAPDDIYLAMKVVMIMGISGACRSIELVHMTVDNIEEHGKLMLVKFPKSPKFEMGRTFVVKEEFVEYVKKYLSLRPENVRTSRLFLKFLHGKCMSQVIGKNKISGMPKEIAQYLKLPNSAMYTGHCFRRTSASLSVNSGADLTLLKRRNLDAAAKSHEVTVEFQTKLPEKNTEAVTIRSGLLSVSSESGGSQVSTSEAAVDPLPDSTPQLKPIKVEKTSSGDQLIIRVTDKLDAKTNVLNRFSVRDGHFENNVIVKEEDVEVQQEMDESSENMETEGDRQEYQEEMFPAAEAILGNSNHQGERDSMLQELNKTLSKFVAEYSERTQLMRERLELERARLQFDMQVFQAQQKKNS